MTIRFAQKMDSGSVRKVIEAAFPAAENKVIMDFVAGLASETVTPPIQSLVAEVDHRVVGYGACTPIFFRPDTCICGYILAPLAVLPNHQKRGVGSNLIRTATDRLAKDGVDVLLVYGDPDYYARFGFKQDIARPFVPPYALEYPSGWLGRMLSDIDCPETPIGFKGIPALNKKDLW